jgi:hypothetical protein
MHHAEVNYGGCRIATMTGDEAGYATAGGEVKLTSISLPPAAMELILAGKAIRILDTGTVEVIEGEPAGLIVFGRYKGDRPALGQ